jgi:hypothetical protein
MSYVKHIVGVFAAAVAIQVLGARYHRGWFCTGQAVWEAR